MRVARYAAPAAIAFTLAACGASGTPTSESSALPARSEEASRSTGGHYVETDLVSNGSVPTQQPPDAQLKNGWGIAALPTSPWWVSDNGTGLSTLYSAAGVKNTALVVTIPGAGGADGAPTGVVANTTTAFVLTSGANSAPARFIFAGEDGTVSAWAPLLGSTATIVFPTAKHPGTPGSVFKGIALAQASGGPRLYVTNFHQGTVEMLDGSFAPVSAPGAFVDPGIPHGFAPFGIRAIGDVVYVTYAMQDADRHDDVAGKHHGFVSAFDTDGKLLRRIASRGKLDSPWGVALAPSDFGPHSNRLLVGNFGDGHLVSFALDGADDADGDPPDEENGEGGGGRYLTGKGGRITIDGLWGIGFGNGADANGPANALFFAAGPNDEADGLFGRIDFAPGS